MITTHIFKSIKLLVKSEDETEFRLGNLLNYSSLCHIWPICSSINENETLEEKA